MTVTTIDLADEQLELVPSENAFDIDSMLLQKRAPRDSIPIISLFSGAGFLDLGFERAGFEVVYRNEFIQTFAEASDHAWEIMQGGEPTKAHQRSIIDVGPNELLKRAFGSLGAPQVFGMIGGPPCPDFSIGGKNKGGTGDRGKLTEVYVERILETLPTFFVLENVKGLVSTYKHRAFLSGLKDRLLAKYTLYERVLNALDFGVPQDRERYFLIGIRARRSQRNIPRRENDPFKWPQSKKYAGSKAKFDWPRTSPFGADAKRPDAVPNELTVWGAIGDSAAIRKLPNGEDMFRPKSKKFHVIAEGDDRRKSFKRLHRWRYSPTAAYGNNEVHLHPTEPRRISVREALRLQSVPDFYEFPAGTPLSAMFKMVGNGVPVRLAEVVALSVARLLEAIGL